MPHKPEFLLRPISEVKSKKVKWLWKPYIPQSMITIMDGNPSLGKTFLALKIAADISTGRKLPAQKKAVKGNVVFLSAEDTEAHVLRPRLETMDADLDRIFTSPDTFSFDDDGLKDMAYYLKLYSPKLVVIDPLFAFFDGSVDIFRANHIRQVMKKIGNLANEHRAAILGVRHLTKAPKEKAIFRGAGAIDIIAAARSAVLVEMDPKNNDLRVMAHMKHNLSKRGKSVSFEVVEIEETELAWVEWRGTVDYTADDLLKVSDKQPPGAPPVAIAAAIEFLQTTLKNGPMLQRNLMAQAEARCISRSTLRRAQKELRIKPKRKNGQWWWALPEA